jgi:hypothetical protein
MHPQYSTKKRLEFVIIFMYLLTEYISLDDPQT